MGGSDDEDMNSERRLEEKNRDNKNKRRNKQKKGNGNSTLGKELKGKTTESQLSQLRLKVVSFD
jgi:hypothetical protein